jgi:hypothetical protein
MDLGPIPREYEVKEIPTRPRRCMFLLVQLYVSLFDGSIPIFLVSRNWKINADSCVVVCYRITRTQQHLGGYEAIFTLPEHVQNIAGHAKASARYPTEILRGCKRDKLQVGRETRACVASELVLIVRYHHSIKSKEGESNRT